jgi:outer membrane protein
MKRDLFRFTALTAWGLAVLALAGPAAAQVQIHTQAETLPGEVPVEVRDGAVQLSLSQAVELALRRNLGLVIERYTRTQARLGIQQALGIYDFGTSADLQASDITRPGGALFTGNASQTEQLTLSVSQLFPTGGTFGLGWQTSRSESDVNIVNPLYSSGLNFSFVQPLLRDFGAIATERQLLIAQNQNLTSTQEFSRQVIATLQQVVDAYWNLVESREQLNVAQQSLGLAKELHERNRIQVEVGTLAPLELVQSEANIATNEEEIIRTQTLVGNAEDELRRLLNLPQGPLWQAEIRPVDDPAVEAPPPVDVEAAIRTALEQRPEVRAQQLAVDLARNEAAYFRNQKLPSLDLTLNYGLNGNNAQVIGIDADGDPILAAGGFGDALDQVTGLDFDGWSARLTLGYPLQNRAARAASAIADLDIERAETTLAQTEQQITTEVRQAARQVDSAAKQIEAAKASVRFQERSLDAEKKRYENGMSSSFEITRIQQDLTSARSRQVTAIIAYRTAVTQLQQATAQLLSTYSVVVDDPEAPVDRWDFSLFGGRAR